MSDRSSRDTGPLGRWFRLTLGLFVGALAGYVAVQAREHPALWISFAAITCGCLFLIVEAVLEWATVRQQHLAEAGAAGAEATQLQHQAEQERLRLWALEDELGIDIDRDGEVGRPRTNRYQPPRTFPDDFPIYQTQGPRARAEAAVANFVKTAWTYSEQQGHDPRRKAVGLARSNWVNEQAGPTSRERQWYDAIISVLTGPPLRLVVDRNPGCGRFAVGLEEALNTVRIYWRYVNVPRILLDTDPSSQPSQTAQSRG